MTEFTSELLKTWGHLPGKRFGQALAAGREAAAQGRPVEAIRDLLEGFKPAPTTDLRPAGDVAFSVNIEAGTADEEDNIRAVHASMTELMRTPTVEAGAVMPDACPAGSLGTIPVGGVVATRDAIHPGMHSADICCSVSMTDFGPVDPRSVLDAAHAVTHFGPGGRPDGRRFGVDLELLDRFRENRFLNNPKILRLAQEHMGTQGDGNHFLFVGTSRSTGKVAMVTHHGSRGPGALLYKAGMAVAERYRAELSPQTLKQNAWIPADSEEGEAYWQALQLIREWTRANHDVLHRAVWTALGREPVDRFWNEHNFVFRRDGLFYHGKGATPAWRGFAADSDERTLIPLNMAEPVLVVRGKDAGHGLGFSPHGAGRNYSRSEHRRRMGNMTAEQMMALETEGLDVRFFENRIDPSELPSGYKNADSVVRQIGTFGLAEIEDYIDPYGCIMAGETTPPWIARKQNRR